MLAVRWLQRLLFRLNCVCFTRLTSDSFGLYSSGIVHLTDFADVYMVSCHKKNMVNQNVLA